MEFNKQMFNQDNDNQVENNIHDDPLTNISLSDSDTNENTNKKKYLLLGTALVTLFVVTILIVKFMSNINEDPLILDEKSSIAQDNILENIDAQQRYQEIIEKRVETLKKEEELKALETPKDIKMEAPIVSDIKEDPKPVKVETKPKKQSPIVSAKPTNLVEQNQLIGSYIQLGAFSKYPSKKFISNIESKNYSVKIYQVEVNGKSYHKVLIGPYETQKESRSKLNTIRKEFKSPKAFIYQ